MPGGGSDRSEREPMTALREALHRAAAALAEAGSEEAALEAELLLAHALGTDRTHLYQRLPGDPPPHPPRPPPPPPGPPAPPASPTSPSPTSPAARSSTAWSSRSRPPPSSPGPRPRRWWSWCSRSAVRELRATGVG